MVTMDFGICVYVESLPETNVTLWIRILIMGEAVVGRVGERYVGT